jgi:hypothetical protein
MPVRKQPDSSTKFLQYLTGLAVAIAPGASAMASPAPAPTACASIEFAPNLAEKLAPFGASALAKPPTSPYKQTFGDLYVQTVFTEVQPLQPGGADEAADATLPSEAFTLLAKTP